MKTNRIFHTANAPAGGGKTQRAIRLALAQAATEHRKSVFVFKSIELLKQAKSDANAHQIGKKMAVPITAIHSKKGVFSAECHSVGSAIHQHLDQVEIGVGELLMITEAAFLNLTYWPNRWMWTIICDEIPAIAPAIKRNIPNNHKLLTGHLVLGLDIGGYSRVEPAVGSRSILQAYAENPKRDEITAVISPLVRQILSPYYESYVATQSYERVCNGEGDGKSHQIELFSVLQPTLFGDDHVRQFEDHNGNTRELKDAFAEVIIMGAAFDSSLLSLIWTQLGIQFAECKEITDELRYKQHECGHRLQIEYLFETDWSKRFRGQLSSVNGVNQSNLEILLAAIEAKFEGSEFLYLVNKDVEQTVGDNLTRIGGQHLPNIPYGLNSYQHIQLPA